MYLFLINLDGHCDLIFTKKYFYVKSVYCIITIDRG